MRLATLVDADGSFVAAVVEVDKALPIRLEDGARPGIRALAADPALFDRVRAWAGTRPAASWLPLAACTLGPAIPDPGAIYTIGLNYRAPGESPGSGPDRPLVYGKAASSVAGDGAVLSRTWTSWRSAIDPGR